MKSNYQAFLKAQLGDEESMSDAEMPEAVEESEDEYPYKDCYDQNDSDSDDKPKGPTQKDSNHGSNDHRHLLHPNPKEQSNHGLNDQQLHHIPLTVGV